MPQNRQVGSTQGQLGPSCGVETRRHPGAVCTTVRCCPIIYLVRAKMEIEPLEVLQGHKESYDGGWGLYGWFTRLVL
jgi:hypothetical protein